MAGNNLSKLSDKDLHKKLEVNNGIYKAALIIFILIILFAFSYEGYMTGQRRETNWNMLITILLLSIGGLIPAHIQKNSIKKEISKRKTSRND